MGFRIQYSIFSCHSQGGGVKIICIGYVPGMSHQVKNKTPGPKVLIGPRPLGYVLLVMRWCYDEMTRYHQSAAGADLLPVLERWDRISGVVWVGLKRGSVLGPLLAIKFPAVRRLWRPSESTPVNWREGSNPKYLRTKL
jgi:hypothetical protein